MYEPTDDGSESQVRSCSVFQIELERNRKVNYNIEQNLIYILHHFFTSALVIPYAFHNK